MENDFEEIPNSFIDAAFNNRRKRDDIQHPKKEIMNNLGSVSALYLYANPPPMAYGTPAPKIAETVLRSYGFNLKKEGKTINIDGFEIDHPVWENKEIFPFGQVHSNWHPGEMHRMACNFLKGNFNYISEFSSQVIENAMTMNSDILTKGRQTWDPIKERSVPSAQAYSTYCDLLVENGFPNHHSLLGIIRYTFELMSRNPVIGYVVEWKEEERIVSLKGQRVRVKKKVSRVAKKQFNNEEAYRYVMGLVRSFCGYNKSGERAHLKRRAIASPSIPMRAFLYLVEEFHLKMGKKIPGSTISIGGDEKKMKIVGTMGSAKVDPEASHSYQATQDATKWNECLSASGFGMMSKTFFDNQVREELGLPLMTKSEELFSQICQASHFFLSIKKIVLGKGLQGKGGGFHGEIDLTFNNLKRFNKLTQEWLEKSLPLMEGNSYLNASSGMLMGMHNAASTTLGLISVGFKKSPECNIYTLRSSDDSMTLYSAPTISKMAEIIDQEDLNLQLCGINLSKKKTFIFKFGYGEYTSWYQDKKMVAQYGPETTTLRPGGNNPPDDFNNLARTTSVSLLKLETNDIGAEAKLRIGIQNIRSLYMIKRKTRAHQGIKDECLLLSDGGLNPWNPANSHLEETSLKKYFATTQEELDYFLRVRNPENPFATEPKEEITWSKDAGSLTVEYVETPRTLFHFVKRANRTIVNMKGKTHADEERHHAEALNLLSMADFSTLIRTPPGSTSMAMHMVSSMIAMASNMELNENEKEIFRSAIEILRKGKQSPDEGVVDDVGYYEQL